MNIPQDRKYSETHEWAQPGEDGSVVVGISDHAQNLLGDVVFVQPPAPGSGVKAGMPCGVVESVKSASDLHAPVSGEVLGVNAELESVPENINQAPYSAWIFKIRPSDAQELDRLMDARAYREFLEKSG